MAGTFFGAKPRIVQINGQHIEARPEGVLLLLENRDVPGIVGKIGSLLGERGVNIATMSLSREDAAGGKALTVINLDSAPDADDARAHPRRRGHPQRAGGDIVVPLRYADGVSTAKTSSQRAKKKAVHKPRTQSPAAAEATPKQRWPMEEREVDPDAPYYGLSKEEFERIAFWRKIPRFSPETERALDLYFANRDQIRDATVDHDDPPII